MNHTYRQIWSARLGCCVAVAEHCRGRGKSAGVKRTLLASVLLGAVLTGVSTLSQAGPAGGSVAAGSGSIAQSGAATTVQQTSNKLVIHWNSFSIGAGESVTFSQPSASAIALNRVTGAGTSQIDGALHANGQVWVLNPNGVLFGNSAQVNVGGLVASTLRLSDSQFLAGNYQFSAEGGQGLVRNQGRLSGGYVALLGSQVSNSGSIHTPGGHTALGAGDAITLNFDGQRLLNLQVNAGAYQALVDNQGLIKADDGSVRLSAVAKDALLQTVVNNSGVVQARGMLAKGGTIELLGGFNGGTVQVGGTLDASSAQHDGGFVETSGAHVKVQDGARISTLAPTGKTGTWLIDPQDYTIAASGGDITGTTLSGQLASNNVTVQSTSGGTAGNGDIFVKDAVTWNAPYKLTLQAQRNIEIQDDITAQNANGQVALHYGLSAVAAGNTASYNLNGGRINLQAGNNFFTKLGSDGTEQSWTVITSLGVAGSITGTDLQGMNGDLTKRYALGADIDASATAGWNSGAGFAPVGNGSAAFTGTLDGLGHSISGLTINRPTTDDIGLIGNASAATNRNVGLLNVNVTGRDYVGGLVGNNYGGGVSYSYATGSVTGRNAIGGLVGYSFYGNVNHSYATASVTGGDNVGGLAGTTNNNSEAYNYATGSVRGDNNVGGLEGQCYACSLGYSYASGPVSGGSNVGGLVGMLYSAAPARYNYATGSVTGITAVGGLVGNNGYISGGVTNSYATGRVTGSTSVGGLMGVNDGGLFDSHWDSSPASTNQALAVGSQNGSVLGVTDVSSAPYGHSSYARLGSWGQQGSSAVWTASVSSNPTWVMIEGQTRPFLYSEYSTRIGNAHQLQLMAMNLGASYTLARDIDASETSGSNASGSNASGMWSSAGFLPVGDATSSFTGTLDGLGHSITGLTINRPSTDYVGLFGKTAAANLRNVGLLGGSVTGQSYVGGLAGLSNNSTVDNSYATGSVTGQGLVGGLVGGSITSTVSNSYATGSVTGLYNDVGGLMGGNNNNGTVSNSYATGNVSGADQVGGLVGSNLNNSSVGNSYASGRVSSTLLAFNYVNGLIGYNDNSSSVNNTVYDVDSTGQIAPINIGFGPTSNLGVVTASNRYASASYGALGAWSCNGALCTATDGSNIPRWVMLEGSTRPFLYSEYSATIRNAHQLQLMAMNLGASYTLAANINASETSGSNASGMWSTAGFVPVGAFATRFTGSLDGLGHTITGLTINRPSTDNVGLFGYAQGAEIRNVGLVGGSIRGNIDVGGLVGHLWGGTVRASFATAAVSAATYTAGGLVGSNENGASVFDSYASGAVQAPATAGGLVGYNAGSINSSYATGAVSPDQSGGLVGFGSGSVNNSYWNITTTGRTSSAGGGAGLSSVQMMQAASYSNWSLATNGGSTSVWRIYEGQTTPLLRSFLTPLTVTQSGAITSRDYDGSRTVAGATVSYSSVPDNSLLLGTRNVLAASKDAGAQATLVDVYSTQQGYDITQTTGAVTITAKPVTLTNTARHTTYDGTSSYATLANGTAFTRTAMVGADTVDSVTQTASALPNGSSTSGVAQAGSFTVTPSVAVLSTGNVSNYSFTYAPSTHTVDRANLAITATPSLSGNVYNGSAYTGSYTSTALGNDAASITVSGLATGTDAGSYTSNLAASGAVLANYNAPTISNANLVISPKPVTITNTARHTTYDGTSSYAALASGAAFTSTAMVGLDAVDSVTQTASGASVSDVAGVAQAGSFTVTPSVAVLSTGSASNYSFTYAPSTHTVDRANLAITATPSLSGNVYNGNAFTGSYTSTALGNDAANISVSGLATGTDAGTYSSSLVTSGAVLANYNTPTISNANLVVDRKPVTITNTARHTTYDGTSSYATLASGTAFTRTAMVGADTVDSVTQTASALPNGSSVSGVAQAGSFTVTPSVAVLSTGNASNYSFTYAPSTHTVDRANLAITATPSLSGNVYNGSAYTGSYTSTALGNDAASITVSGLATGTDAGSYTSSLAASGAVLANYNAPTISNASLVISPKPVTLTNTSRHTTYDGTSSYAMLASGTAFTRTAMVGADTVDSVTQTASALPNGSSTSGVAQAGSFTVTPSAVMLSTGNVSNYNFTYAPSTHTVDQAALTVTALPDAFTESGRIYAGGHGLSYSGLVGGQDASVLAGSLQYGGTAQGAMLAGRYAITASGLQSANYDIAYADGVLTIAPMPTGLADALAAAQASNLARSSPPPAKNSLADLLTVEPLPLPAQ